jgi:hypothetical protein
MNRAQRDAGYLIAALQTYNNSGTLMDTYNIAVKSMRARLQAADPALADMVIERLEDRVLELREAEQQRRQQTWRDDDEENAA